MAHRVLPLVIGKSLWNFYIAVIIYSGQIIVGRYTFRENKLVYVKT